MFSIHPSVWRHASCMTVSYILFCEASQESQSIVLCGQGLSPPSHTLLYHRAMLRRARRFHSMPSVCPSVCLRPVCNVQVPWSHSSEYFENNFTAKVSAPIGPNKGDLVQREQPQN